MTCKKEINSMKTHSAKRTQILRPCIPITCIFVSLYTCIPVFYETNPNLYLYLCHLWNRWLKNLCGSLCNSVAKFKNDKTNPI
jgi:hypothetical protein